MLQKVSQDGFGTHVTQRTISKLDCSQFLLSQRKLPGAPQNEVGVGVASGVKFTRVHRIKIPENIRLSAVYDKKSEPAVASHLMWMTTLWVRY